MQRNTQSIQFCKSHVATMLWKTGWRQLSASPMKVLPRRRAWVWHSPLSILIRVSNGKNLPTHQRSHDVRRIAPLPKVVLEDARFTVYENEREVIATYVSTYGLQRQSSKGIVSSNVKPNIQDFILNTQMYMIKQYKRGLSTRSYASWLPYVDWYWQYHLFYQASHASNPCRFFR